MEEGFKIRHPARHEAAVLANWVATERRLSGRYIAIQKGEQLFGGVLFIQRGSAHPFDQSRTAMHFLIPRIHAFKHFIALMERQRRPFNRDVKTGIRHNNGNFKKAFGSRPQTALSMSSQTRLHSFSARSASTGATGMQSGIISPLRNERPGLQYGIFSPAGLRCSIPGHPIRMGGSASWSYNRIHSTHQSFECAPPPLACYQAQALRALARFPVEYRICLLQTELDAR